MNRLLFSALALAALGASAAGKRPFDDADVAAGKPLYIRECAGCHGERGDGQGPAAQWLEIKPRDFTKKMFKLRTTASGEGPTTADLARTIERGIPGTAMPSFSFLTPEERRLILGYVCNLADDLDEPEPNPLPDPGEPPATTPESIERGKQIYADMGCAACHGQLGKGDGPSAAALKDDEGRAIKVRDFTSGVFRGGSERKDLYWRFVTGMDGTPMPSFADNVQGADRWALVDYVMSLKVPPKNEPLPKNPIAAGRLIAEKYGCRGCHVLDDGKGGDVGPDLRISGQKLDPAWVKTFLSDPRAWGKIYPWRPQRMPRIALAPEEVDAAAAYIATMGKRTAPPKQPDVASFPDAKVNAGKNYFVLVCAQCHTLGKVIETPAATQQGPDLSRVSGRVDFDWSKRWVENPKKIDPKTRMTVPGITPEQAEAVRMFVWKTSVEQKAAAAGGAAGAR